MGPDGPQGVGEEGEIGDPGERGPEGLKGYKGNLTHRQSILRSRSNKFDFVTVPKLFFNALQQSIDAESRFLCTVCLLEVDLLVI